ncbi:MAG: hypothetical protein IJU84_09135, partial [Clostridia bacterium]|nr:hypothetical protein [Clostridia bacterium]
IVIATEDATYTATFDSVVNKYTITWKNGEDVIETDENVEYDETPEYDGETPTKEADAQYTYTFSGWTPEIVAATEDATYTATYDSVLIDYTVTFKTHDGSTVLATIDNCHYGDEITGAPEIGTTYEIDGTTYEICAYQIDSETVTGNMEILAASYKCAPQGKVQGLFYVYTDGDENGGVAPTDTYISFSAHNTLGGLTTLNGEMVLYRTHKNAAGLDQNSALSLRFASGEILTEIYVPFYVASVEGGDGLDMNMRLYSGSMATTLPVVYKDKSGNTVEKAALQPETWYTAVYTLSGATASFNQQYKLTMCTVGASVDLYYGRPYFSLMDGVSVETFNTEIKNGLATAYAAYNAKTEEVFACDAYSVKYFTYYNGSLIPVFDKNVNLSFSESLWGQYLDYQTSGGKVMTMDVKFVNVGTNAVSYNGEIYNGSSYGAISNAASNTFRTANKFFLFYNSDGQSVNYQNITMNTWYKMVIDIDAIKAGVAAQNTRVWGGRNCSSIFFRSGDDGVAIGNVGFEDNQIAFKNGGGGTVTSYFDNGELVTVGTSSHQWNGRLFLSDAVWNKYLAAQEEGGKVMRMNIKFDDTVSLSGYLSGSGANLNTYRGNTTYFRFFNENGEAVSYSDLEAGTWYRLDLDIDAIKTGIGAQSTAAGAEPNIKFARESAGTISVKNVQFAENDVNE